MSAEDSRIDEYRQSTFHQTKTSNDIKLNVVLDEADARNSLENILCSLRFDGFLDCGIGIPASCLLWMQGMSFQLPPLMAQSQFYGKEKQKVSSMSNLIVGPLNFRVRSLLLVSSFTSGFLTPRFHDYYSQCLYFLFSLILSSLSVHCPLDYTLPVLRTWHSPEIFCIPSASLCCPSIRHQDEQVSPVSPIPPPPFPREQTISELPKDFIWFFILIKWPETNLQHNVNTHILTQNRSVFY